ARNGVRFLVEGVRPDGSWPIDTNLATWVTTLSVNALAAAGELEHLDRRTELAHWLVGQQVKDRHPYTGAEPGGRGWAPLPGSVPDADDTPGAVLALEHLRPLLSAELRRGLPGGEKSGSASPVAEAILANSVRASDALVVRVSLNWGMEWLAGL